MARRERFLSLVCLLVLVTAGTPNRASDEPGGAKPPGLSRREALEEFRKLDPAERLRRAEKLADGGEVFVPVRRADLVVTVVERGTVEPAESSDLVCRVKARTVSSRVATTVKWVIEEGTLVKKEQRLVELDDSALRDELLHQKITLEKATADRVGAEEDLKIARAQNKLDLRRAEINLKLAKLALKKVTGEDADEKESRELAVEDAQLSLEANKLQSKSREVKAAINAKAMAAVEEQEVKRKRDIEAQVEACVLKAPRDGLVIYHAPEAARRAGGASALAEGESVREGQKLLRVCGLERFVVNVRVHEALVARVAAGQPAVVRVDAFPGRALRGRVKSVAALASQADWLSSDVKVYPTLVAITDKLEGLKPGMTAEVRIEVGRREKVLRVPAESVLRSGRETFCYVKVDRGLRERKVTTGARNDFFVEVTAGLKEGELVLRAPGAVAGASARLGASGARTARAGQILVRSVRPAPGAPAGRARTESYGLTDKDLVRIRALPDVTGVAPVRSFPVEARRRKGHHSRQALATVPAYRELAGVRLAAGRFLEDRDGLELKNVAVLGADAAGKLFPEQDPVGKAVRLGSHFYVVVGVLREQEGPAGGLTADEVNAGAYVPLETARVRFGAVLVVRRASAFTREAVALNEILVEARSPARADFLAESTAAILEESHARKDWEVRRAR
jgi:multidrug resistance efflux pump